MNELTSAEFLDLVKRGNEDPQFFASLVSSGRAITPADALAASIGETGTEISGPRIACNGSQMSCMGIDDMPATKVSDPTGEPGRPEPEKKDKPN